MRWEARIAILQLFENTNSAAKTKPQAQLSGMGATPKHQYEPVVAMLSLLSDEILTRTRL
jgi:hypothetical protein